MKDYYVNNYYLLGLMLITMIVSIAASSPLTQKTVFSVRAHYASCEGISQFHTGIFTDDYKNLLDTANECYNSTETVHSQIKLYTPKDLTNCPTGIDCEDISHMINCLAAEYDIECFYYVQLTYPGPSHVGIKCDVGAPGDEWRELY